MDDVAAWTRAWIAGKSLQPQPDGTFLVRPFTGDRVFALPDEEACHSYVDDARRRNLLVVAVMVGIVIVEVLMMWLETNVPGLVLFGWTWTLALTGLALVLTVAVHVWHRHSLKRLGAQRAPRALWNHTGRRPHLVGKSNAEVEGQLVACVCIAVLCTMIVSVPLREVMHGGSYWPGLFDVLFVAAPFYCMIEAITCIRELYARRRLGRRPPVGPV
jgi:hypothetical protein